MNEREHITTQPGPTSTTRRGSASIPSPDPVVRPAHNSATRPTLNSEARRAARGSDGEDGKRPKAVVGIFVGKRSKSSRRRPYGSESARLARMIRLGTQRGILVYVFSHGQVRWDDRKVEGLTLSDSSAKQADWEETLFPLPDVVYDRIPSRRAERRQNVQETKRTLQQKYRNLYFNPGYFDKWQVHRLLAKTRMSRITPETRRFCKFKSFRSMLHRYGALYLKPTKGSQGKGIFIVSKVGGGYTLKRAKATARPTHHYRSAPALFSALRSLIGHRSYIVQPNLHLARWGGRPFDVRILMQKDGEGKWQRTKMYARVAARGALTSNLSMGGVGIPLPKLLPSIFGRHSASIFRRCRRLGTRVARSVESAMGIELGELGIDLGISRRGRVWLIEVNSKPFRRLTTRRGTMEQVRQSLVRPLEYAAYLANRHEEATGGPSPGWTGKSQF